MHYKNQIFVATTRPVSDLALRETREKTPSKSDSRLESANL